MLSSEMPHGVSQIEVPHYMHAMHNAVFDGVDAEAHKIFNSRHVQYCCCERAGIMLKTGGITLKMKHCLGVFLFFFIPWGIQKSLLLHTQAWQR